MKICTKCNYVKDTLQFAYNCKICLNCSIGAVVLNVIPQYQKYYITCECKKLIDPIEYRTHLQSIFHKIELTKQNL
jgi:hypothetical protein